MEEEMSEKKKNQIKSQNLIKILTVSTLLNVLLIY